MTLKLLVALGGLLLLAACTAGPNPMAHTLAADGHIAGFWLGLWHGVISPITFVISLFSSNVHVYEVHNTGGWYNFGFLFGAAATFGGSSQAA